MSLLQSTSDIMYSIYFICVENSESSYVAQVVRRSPPTTGVPSSRLSHSMWVPWRTQLVFIGVLPFFPSLKLHSTISPHLPHSFHFISPCDGASGVVGRHSCLSQTYNKGATSRLIPRPGPVSDMSWGCLFNFLCIEFSKTAWFICARCCCICNYENS